MPPAGTLRCGDDCSLKHHNMLINYFILLQVNRPTTQWGFEKRVLHSQKF